MKNKLLLAALCFAATNAHAGCGSSFCSVNTYWDTQGLTNADGLRLDLRYSYAKADTPRVGSNKVAKPSATDPALAGIEVENLRTINQILDLDASYPLNDKWNVSMGLPVVVRDHAHQIGAATPALVTTEQRSFTEIGDIRLLASYKFDSGDRLSGSGVRFGLKLPTGATNLEMAPGKLMEAGLQPGSGSTDVVLGAHYFQDFAQSPLGWFVSAQVQTAVTLKNDYRPGNDAALDLGMHYTLSPATTALLQLNTHLKQADSGTAPNMNPHTGGKSLNISPGISHAITPLTKVYGFVQLPLYQYANPDPAGSPYGQLTAPWSMSIGLSRTF